MSPRSLPLPVRVVFAAALLICAATVPAAASDLYNFTASIFGTVGGALDVSGEDPGVDRTGFQLGFAWVTQPKAQVGVRLGQVSMDGEQLEGLFDPELSYATIGGEYRYRENFYDSGVFLGLGLYQLEGLAGGMPQRARNSDKPVITRLPPRWWSQPRS